MRVPGVSRGPEGQAESQENRRGERWLWGTQSCVWQPRVTIFILCPAHLSVSRGPQRNHIEGCDLCLVSPLLSAACEWYSQRIWKWQIALSGMVSKVSRREGYLYQDRVDRAWLLRQEPKCVYGHGMPSMEAPKAS